MNATGCATFVWLLVHHADLLARFGIFPRPMMAALLMNLK
jgi:hypothetical protein